MTAAELRDHLMANYGIRPWPKTYEVDAETYANAVQAVLATLKGEAGRDWGWFDVAVGSHGGIMFKGVELLLKPPV